MEQDKVKSEKCDGLPLAAKLVGGVLQFEEDPEKWKKILERDMLDVHKDTMLPILRLSYRFLPSHLKRCFAYCAVFPKDYEFRKENLIRLWMAEGLLPQHKMNNVEIEEVEKVGENCFNALVSRSFFQKSGVTDSFLMHDLINELAKSISREFCYRHGVDEPCKKTETIRHLRLCHDWEVDEVDESIFPIQHLRTIFSPNKDVVNWLPTLTRCRVFSGLCFFKLPDSMGNLMHLRYLDLSYSLMERLPDTVTSSCNLETLILYGCRFLVELPATIFKLINLSLLDIRRTNLGKMPPHMGKLKKLGELDYYIVGRESDCSIKELGPLKRLRGRLRIEKLRNVSQDQEAAEASLKCKEKLKELELIWNGGDCEDSSRERDVLGQLQPHTNIEQLSISGYEGTTFPAWVGDSSFSNMVELKLEEGRNCISLPALGRLGSLKRLSIIGFGGIAVVGPEFYGNSNEPPFGCLESLEFIRMPQWQEWVPYSNMDEGDGATAAFPLLRKLRIVNCTKLKEIQPTHHLPSLTELGIEGCSSLESLLLDSAPALQRLTIRDCSNLKEIQPTPLPSLTDLQIEGCDQLVSLPRAPALQALVIEYDSHDVALGYRNPSHSALERLMPLELKTLGVDGWDTVTSLPLDLFPMLESVQIFNCPKLESLSAASQAQPLQRCTELLLSRCPNLRRLPECMAALFPSLMKLSIGHFPVSTVVDLLRIYPNLSHLYLNSCCEEVESFPPENMFLPPTLTSLEIWNFPNVRSLDITAFKSLTHLTDLQISNCPKLQSIPEAELFSSLPLSSLGSCGCPAATRR